MTKIIPRAEAALGWRWRNPMGFVPEIRFAPDSPLEQEGFELVVPARSQGRRHLFADEKGRRSIGMAVNGGVYFVGDPRFGSRLRRRRVHFRRELRFHASRGFRGTPWPKGILRMRPPRRGLEQLDLLGHQQWPELRGEPLDEILICVHGCPMGSPAGVVIEFP